MKITILGCGASSAIPLIGCDCRVCTSGDGKNKRLRVSILLQYKEKQLLIDTSPDLRQQCLNNDITAVDAIIYTHAHADHIHGIDDVRSLNYHKDAAIDCYGDGKTLTEIKRRFAYAFKPHIPEYGWFRPCLVAHEISAYREFDIADGITILPFTQIHGKTESLGFRIGGFAYSTDVNSLPEKSFSVLSDLDLWVVDCLGYEPAPTHAHLELTLQWIKRLKPRRALLTHMGHDFEYHELKKSLPTGVEPAFDGMSISLA